MDHPLEIWRIKEGIPTKKATAARLGISLGQYTDIAAGRTYPSAARIREIVEETNGAVTADDLVMWEAA